MARPTKVHADPTRAFFVRMITRDITLEDCILDLIDNSVDAAWKNSGGHALDLADETDLSEYEIEIGISQSEFSISDNCGGISFEEAVDRTFTFGRSDEYPDDDYSIGVYGIGMKRAIFKLGNQIEIRSTHQTETTDDHFRVPIDVQSWLADKQATNWDFNIEDYPAAKESGVIILVTELNEGAAAEFSTKAFANKLSRIVGRDYSLHLQRGLQVKINGELVKRWPMEMLVGEEIAPFRTTTIIENSGREVKVEILAGMLAPPPDDYEPDEDDRDENRSGWYVICNGRVVLAANKTELTGWGASLAKWHPQYSGFIGLIVFSSKHAVDLPLTTTKRNVDQGAAVYRKALASTTEVTKTWTSYTNARKGQIKYAQSKEASSKALDIRVVEASSTMGLPILEDKKAERLSGISYKMPSKQVTALAEAMGDISMANKDVGIKSFDYAYSDFVGEK